MLPKLKAKLCKLLIQFPECGCIGFPQLSTIAYKGLVGFFEEGRLLRTKGKLRSLFKNLCNALEKLLIQQNIVRIVG